LWEGRFTTPIPDKKGLKRDQRPGKIKEKHDLDVLVVRKKGESTR
jgi:hypothetical protein